MTEYIYRAEYDTDAENPFTWFGGWGGELVLVDSGFDSAFVSDLGAYVSDLENAESGVLQAVNRVMTSNAVDQAYPWYQDRLEFAVKVVRRLYPDSGLFSKKIRGHTQSEWWLVVGTGTVPLKAIEQWLRGDVWTVTKYRTETCSLGHEHQTDVDISGSIFADTEEEAIEYFKENYG